MLISLPSLFCALHPASPTPFPPRNEAPFGPRKVPCGDRRRRKSEGRARGAHTLDRGVSAGGPRRRGRGERVRSAGSRRNPSTPPPPGSGELRHEARGPSPRLGPGGDGRAGGGARRCAGRRERGGEDSSGSGGQRDGGRTCGLGGRLTLREERKRGPHGWTARRRLESGAQAAYTSSCSGHGAAGGAPAASATLRAGGHPRARRSVPSRAAAGQTL